MYSDISFDILSRILSDLVFGIRSDLVFGIRSDLLPALYIYIHMLSDKCSAMFFGILGSIWQCF